MSTLPTTLDRPETITDEDVSHEEPWKVIVLNDPVNLMGYVTLAFMKVLSMTKEVATKHMMEVHTKGESVVWIGGKEKAEHYVQELLAWKLNAKLST